MISDQKIEAADLIEAYVKKILASRVYDLAIETPTTFAPKLSNRLGIRVSLKREDMQEIFSFKVRGAYNKLSYLSSQEKKQGVIAASAGNHAQGVSIAARELGIAATIVMSHNTPGIKVASVKDIGAKVILEGDNYDAAAQYAKKLSENLGLALIPPYDDPDIIAGQGTVGLEIINQHGEDLECIFVPVGGGGLIAGIAAYAKYVRPDIKIVGVEAEGSACLTLALERKKRVALNSEKLDLFADGVSVAQVGKEPFKIARYCVDSMVTVNTDEICAAIKDVFEDTRTIAEPAGALAIAGLKKYAQQNNLVGPSVAIVSGANVNFDRLRHISERAEVGEAKEKILGVGLEEKPGSFLKFSRDLGSRAVSEFNYRLGDATRANVYVGIEVESGIDAENLFEDLKIKGYPITDLTENEAAKVHLRHMVGGKPKTPISEAVFRFEFPERKGALLKFLNNIGSDWDITLFHYRNHGAAWGRVLVGFSVQEKPIDELRKHLVKVGYRYWEETHNEGYNLFLR